MTIQRVKISGIYTIKNTVTDEQYIGSSKNVHQRFRQHRYLLRHAKHYCLALFNAFTRGDPLEYELLVQCEPGFLVEQEQRFLDIYKPTYNRNVRADAITFTRDIRDRIGASVKRRWAVKDGLTRRDMSKAAGFSPDLILSRMSRGQSLEAASTTPVNAGHRKGGLQLEYEGKSWTLSALAVHCGMTPPTLCRRLKSGMTLQEAIDAPLRVWPSQQSKNHG